MTPPTRHNHHNTRVSTPSRRRRVPTESAASNEMPCSAIRAPTAHERAGTGRSRLDLATRLDRTPKTVKHNLTSQLTNADFLCTGSHNPTRSGHSGQSPALGAFRAARPMRERCGCDDPDSFRDLRDEFFKRDLLDELARARTQ